MALASVILSSIRLIKEFRRLIFSDTKIVKGGHIFVFNEVVFPQFPDSRIDGLLLTVKGGVIKDAALWEDYLELKNIRDRIIHIKSIDIEYNKTNDFFNHLWNDLVNNGNLKNYTGNTKKIIEYYLEDKKPSWFEKCPF